ncbi:hypothetical protein BdWA1_001965 [Babesia duncani]|uniref:Signal peptide containing protein n=1 Tax=Babesia duncani TaxID=323732 RepID=A0AAD9PLG1_9APIC|nr:hypothetical protein BdWA1_001965 [Babesia duncani]
MDLCFVYAFVILAYGVNGVAVPLDIIETTETGNIRKGLYGKEDNLKADESKNIEQIDLNGEGFIRFITATKGFCFDKITFNGTTLLPSLPRNCPILVTWEYWNKMDFISFYIKSKRTSIKTIYQRTSKRNWTPIAKSEYGKLELMYKPRVTLDIDKVENIPGIKYIQHVYNSEIFRVFDVLQYVFIYKIVSNGVTIINLSGRNNVGSRCVRVIIHGYDGTSQRVRVVIMDEFGKLNNADFYIYQKAGFSRMHSIAEKNVWDRRIKLRLATLNIGEVITDDNATHISSDDAANPENESVVSNTQQSFENKGEPPNGTTYSLHPVRVSSNIINNNANNRDVSPNTLLLDNADPEIVNVETISLPDDMIIIYKIMNDTFYDVIEVFGIIITLRSPLNVKAVVIEGYLFNWLVLVNGVDLHDLLREVRVKECGQIWIWLTDIAYKAYEILHKQRSILIHKEHGWNPGVNHNREFDEHGRIVDYYNVNKYHFINGLWIGDSVVLYIPEKAMSTERIVKVKVSTYKNHRCEILLKDSDDNFRKVTKVYDIKRGWISTDAMNEESDIAKIPELQDEELQNQSIPQCVPGVWKRILHSVRGIVNAFGIKSGFLKDETTSLEKLLNIDELESNDNICVNKYGIEGKVSIVKIEIDKTKGKYNSLKFLNSMVSVGQRGWILEYAVTYKWDNKTIITYGYIDEKGYQVKQYSRYNGAEWIPMELNEYENIFYNEMPRLDLDISAKHVNDGITVKTSFDNEMTYNLFTVDECLLIGEIMDTPHLNMLDIKKKLQNARLLKAHVTIASNLYSAAIKLLIQLYDEISWYQLIYINNGWMLNKR